MWCFEGGEKKARPRERGEARAAVVVLVFLDPKGGGGAREE